MSSRVFASEFVSSGGLESVLCTKILSDRTPHVVTDWLLLIMHLARGNKENYPLLDAASVLEPMTVYWTIPIQLCVQELATPLATSVDTTTFSTNSFESSEQWKS